MNQNDVSNMTTILKDLRKSLDDFKERRSTAQNITQHMNAGGHAVWAVTLMAAIIGTIAMMQQPRIADHERKIDRLEDYLSAIYQINPGLKEKVEANVHDHHYYPASASEETK